MRYLNKIQPGDIISYVADQKLRTSKVLNIESVPHYWSPDLYLNAEDAAFNLSFHNTVWNKKKGYLEISRKY